MFRKHIRRFFILATLTTALTGLWGCSSKNDTATSSDAAVEDGSDTSGETVSDVADTTGGNEAIATDTTATATDAYYPELDSDGNYILGNIRFAVPDSYEYNPDGSTEANLTFVDESEGAAFIIAVETDTSIYDGVDIVGAFDLQVKTYYGDSVGYSKVTYSDHEGTEWVLDNSDAGFVGRSLVLIDDTAIVYIEYLNYSGNIVPYQNIAGSIEFN